MAEILSTVSTVSLVLAVVFFVLAVFFWIKFRILEIIGDLTGRTAKKSIAKMRENNEKTGKKSFKTSEINIQRGKLTGKMKDSEKLDKKDFKKFKDEPETELLAEGQVDNFIENTTEVLNYNVETGLLNEEYTEVLESNATTVLNKNNVKVSKENSSSEKLRIIEDIVLIHTNEMI